MQQISYLTELDGRSLMYDCPHTSLGVEIFARIITGYESGTTQEYRIEISPL